MKATFEDFISQNGNCSHYKSNVDAQNIFYFLNQDRIIIKMIDAVEQGRPALLGCVVDLEDFIDSNPNPGLDFKQRFIRASIGKMIKTILLPFGYKITNQRVFPQNKRGKYFRSASCYTRTGYASMRVVKKIEPIPSNHQNII